MNRNKSTVTSPAGDKAEIERLTQDVLAYSKQNADLYSALRTKNFWIGAFVVVSVLLSLVVIPVSISGGNAQRALEWEQEKNASLIWELQLAERKLNMYERADAEEALARAEAKVRALRECEVQVSASMADVTTDTFGNPIDVSTFAQQSCEDELDKVGSGNFIDKFKVEG